jgi:hypothetical protein
MNIRVAIADDAVLFRFDKLRLPPGEADNRRVLAVLRYLGS